jgi:dolichol-phosphate mannosyltransferase
MHQSMAEASRCRRQSDSGVRLPVLRFLKFGLVGGSGVLVNAGILYGLTEWVSLDYRLAAVGAIELAIIHNFTWNYLWTWRERRPATPGGWIGMFLKFNFSSGLTALALNWGILVFLTEIAGVHYLISNLAGIAAGTIANFCLSHFWAFAAPSPDSRPPKR